MTDEWTFVSHKKRSSKPIRQCRHASGRSINGGDGHHRTPATNYSATNRNDDGMKRFFDNQINPQTTQSEAVTAKDRERIRDAILESINALETILKTSESSFSYQLIAALRKVSASNKSDTTNENENHNYDDDESSNLKLCEIVAYGIGNFGATTSFSAPMLQLACVLFLRRHAASSNTLNSTNNTSKDDIQNIFKREQDKVPIYYYEPCILPVERDLLETVFHVSVLENNEFGKLNVQSMRRRQDSDQVTITTTSRDGGLKTLFYMPHCPMRLYCNVLWSHWESLGPTIMYGNSFHSYDERTLSEERRRNPTNGVLRIIPCTNETSIKARGSRRDEDLYDALNYLETAFNDCNIISFTALDSLPDRPEEYFASQDPENSELSR